MQRLLNKLNSKVHIDSELQLIIQQAFQKEEVDKGQLLSTAHKTVRKLYFIERGIFRTFYEHEVREVTSWFYREDEWMTSWYSFYSQQPAFETIEALEKASVLSLDIHQYRSLIQTHPAFERYMRLLAEEQLTFIDFAFKGYQFMSAKEKYQLLVGHFPDIELRVKLGYIASYLGITQETLSRLRKER